MKKSIIVLMIFLIGFGITSLLAKRSLAKEELAKAERILNVEKLKVEKFFKEGYFKNNSWDYDGLEKRFIGFYKLKKELDKKLKAYNLKTKTDLSDRVKQYDPRVPLYLKILLPPLLLIAIVIALGIIVGPFARAALSP